jgi:hypothetical protein
MQQKSRVAYAGLDKIDRVPGTHIQRAVATDLSNSFQVIAELL